MSFQDNVVGFGCEDFVNVFVYVFVGNFFCYQIYQCGVVQGGYVVEEFFFIEFYFFVNFFFNVDIGCKQFYKFFSFFGVWQYFFFNVLVKDCYW